MQTLFRNEDYSNAKNNAQRNLIGRTHYVDNDTLKYFHSRIMKSRATDDGLLFWIITSDAKDHENRSRGFRYVIFDIFGTVVQRNPGNVEMEYFKTSDKARTALNAALAQIDAKALTRAAIAKAEKRHADEMARIRSKLDEMA